MKIMACQVGPFHLKLTQINLEMNCIAKHKCTDESQKLDAEVRTWMHMPHHTRHEQVQQIFLHSLLHYSMWYKKSVRKPDFHSEAKSDSVEFGVIIVTRPIGDSHQDLNTVKQNKMRVALNVIE